MVVFTSSLKTSNFYISEDLVDNYIIPAKKSPKTLEENKETYSFITDLIPLEDSSTYIQEFRFDDDKLSTKMIQILNDTI